MSEDTKNRFQWTKEIGQMNIVSMFAMIIITNVIVGGLIGYFLDKITFQNKVLFIVFLILGIISGMNQGIRELLKVARKIEKDEERQKKAKNGD